jgi:hypothetical protein
MKTILTTIALLLFTACDSTTATSNTNNSETVEISEYIYLVAETPTRYTVETGDTRWGLYIGEKDLADSNGISIDSAKVLGDGSCFVIAMVDSLNDEKNTELYVETPTVDSGYIYDAELQEWRAVSMGDVLKAQKKREF